MKRLTKSLSPLICLLSFAALLGCKRPSGEDKAVVDGASKLPGVSEVQAALKKGDFDAAVAGVVKVREACTTEEQQLQFSVFLSNTRQQLVEISATNSAANQAAMAIRAMTGSLR